MSLSAAAACIAALLFGTSMNTLVEVNESKQSTKAIIQSQQETQEQIKKATEEKPQQVINNYNVDNSVTNIDNSVTNVDNSTIIIENGNSEDDEIVLPEKKEEECINVGNNRLIPVGDEKDDIDPNPNVVLIKNAECPKCGEHSYIEQYNKHDVYFQHYIGMCKSCNFEY